MPIDGEGEYIKLEIFEMSDDGWRYDPFESLAAEPGVFDIWVYGAEKNQLSGCAYEIRRSTTGFLLESSEPLITDRLISKQWRAYLAAAVRGVERLPANSRGTVCSYNEPLLNLVRDIDQYRQNGWRKGDMKPLADLEIVLRLVRARDGDESDRRGIILSSRPAATETDALILYRLREKVQNALKARVREISVRNVA